MKPIDSRAGRGMHTPGAAAHALSDSEGTDWGSREFEAAVSEGWPVLRVLSDGAGSIPLRRSHTPADGRTSDDHAHDDEHR
jgi:hypothetical protein